MGHFPTWNITYFKWIGVFQHLLDKFIVTNDTYSENRHIYVDIEHIWTQLDFVEVFQVREFPNFEYPFLQVIWCASAFIS